MDKKIIAIILGNRLNDDGSITKIQEDRLLMAVEIENLFKPSYFILTGGLANKKAGKTEAEAMAEYLLQNYGDLFKDKLILENDSISTIQNAKFSIPICEKLNAEIVIVCSSGYHFADSQYEAMKSFIKEIEGTGIKLMTYTR